MQTTQTTSSFSNEHLTRQLDLVPIDKLGTPITIIGAGAIGSWTTLALAKMGFGSIKVFDFDKVDTVNLNSQFYPFDSVGQYKVAALSKLVKEFTQVEITPIALRVPESHFPGIVICAVDSMSVRRQVWETHKGTSPWTKAIIDPRMGAESALLYVMNPMDSKDHKAYEKTLYSDTEAVHEPCTAKATIYTANLLAGLVCKAVKDLITTDDYLRTAQWDIKGNQLECFTRFKSHQTGGVTVSPDRL
jgi:molybdopterin/thiamine biosynthesis adenylyltransferase